MSDLDWGELICQHVSKMNSQRVAVGIPGLLPVEANTFPIVVNPQLPNCQYLDDLDWAFSASCPKAKHPFFFCNFSISALYSYTYCVGSELSQITARYRITLHFEITFGKATTIQYAVHFQITFTADNVTYLSE